MYKDIDCPYCDAGQDVCHDDGAGYEEGVLHEMRCDSCGKRFAFTTSISYDYEPQKADCLNDGAHAWSQTHTTPIEYTKMECEGCGERRHPTPEEWGAINSERKP